MPVIRLSCEVLRSCTISLINRLSTQQNKAHAWVFENAGLFRQKQYNENGFSSAGRHMVFGDIFFIVVFHTVFHVGSMRFGAAVG